MRIRPLKKKLNKIQRQAAQRERRDHYLIGEGVYEFRNIRKGDLNLPKPALDGKKFVPPNGTFQGDSYFFGLQRSGDIACVRTISEPETKVETIVESADSLKPSVETKEDMEMTKLIVDQPDRVTHAGKTEQVLRKPEVKLNEGQPVVNEEPTGDVLLNDDPVSGVEILAD